jgi:hypothetical protein
MGESWVTVAVADLQPGDRVRVANGNELTVSRIEPGFFGRANMVALIEDTPSRWFKQPVADNAEVEVQRAG